MRKQLASVFLTLFVVSSAAAQAPPTAPSGQGEIAPANFTFSRMWKGQELWPFAGDGQGKFEGSKDPNDWQGIGGAMVSFNYSGTGPLPAPKEFVIKLDKPLPYGPAYRLFVKNFYEGRMEATVSDVTRPVEIKRFDWTPGALFEPNTQFKQIVLRYFPSDIVADTAKKQEQYYIVQGVFLTTDANRIPIKAGEILETVPVEKPPARKGNYLDNGSFEVGLFPWGKPFGVSGAYGPENLDDATAAEGQSSFKRVMKPGSGPQRHDGTEEPILETRNYRLPPASYTLSFHAKADKPGARLHARLNGVTEDLKGDANTPLTKSVELTDQWQQYSVTADVQALAGFLYSLKFSIESKRPATVWLDAVQLQNGKLTKFQPGNPTEVGYVCSTLGNIFYEGQVSSVDLLVHDTSGKPRAMVDYRVIDYWSREIDKGQKQVPVSANRGRVALTLPATRGLFRVLFSAGDSSSEMVYSVVPANSHLETKYVEGTIGVDAAFEDKQLAILKRANFNWVLSKFLARWARIEREPGKYEFMDEEIAAAERAGMMVVLQPLNIDWDVKGNQKWLWPSYRPRMGTGVPWEKKDVYMTAWGKFIYELVNRYKGTVKYWEIENEPNAAYTPQEYAQLLQIAIENARRADPQAKVVAGSGGGYYPEYYETMLQTVGPEKVDVLSLHIYTGNDLGEFAPFAALLKKYNKPGWNTETGSTCPTFFTTLPEYEQFRQKGYWESIQKEVRAQTVGSLKNYLLSMSVARMEKYFHYFGRFVNSGPSQPTRRFGSGKELTEFDGSLRANGVALCVASHYLDGAKYHGSVPLDERLQVHVFQKGGSSVGFLWGRAEPLLTLAPAEGLSFFDIMGNPIDVKTLSVTDSPIYFTFEGNAKSCQMLLSSMKVL